MSTFAGYSAPRVHQEFIIAILPGHLLSSTFGSDRESTTHRKPMYRVPTHGDELPPSIITNTSPELELQSPPRNRMLLMDPPVIHSPSCLVCRKAPTRWVPFGRPRVFSRRCSSVLLVPGNLIDISIAPARASRTGCVFIIRTLPAPTGWCPPESSCPIDAIIVAGMLYQEPAVLDLG
jgi:hypothetical protein